MNQTAAPSGNRQDRETNSASVASAESVLAEFDSLRKELLGLLKRAEHHAKELGNNAQQMIPFFKNARNAVDLTRLNLTVVGGEGHGKSTLINSIIGHEVSPSERKYPGTVAPTYVEAGGSLTPSFSVTLRTDGGPVEQACSGLDEFRSFILQHRAYNKDNAKGVICGTVRVNNAALNRGLRIVDMPGLQAANPLVNEQARRFIREQTHALVVVCRERMGFRALHSIIEDLGVDVARVHALVLNCSEKDFQMSDGTGRALSDGQLREFLRSLKEEVKEEFSVSVENVFTIYLPTMEAVRVHNQAPLIPAPAHLEEVERFLSHLWGFIRRNGVADVIENASQEATAALLQLAKRLEMSQQVVDALIKGDPQAQERVKAQFEQARERARGLWRAVGNDSVVKGIALSVWSSGPPPEIIASADKSGAHRVAADQWRPIKGAVATARDAIVAAIDDVLKQVEATSGKIGENKAAEWRKKVELARLRSYEKLELVQKDFHVLITQYYVDHANAALRTIYQEVSLLSNLKEGGLVLDPKDPERVALGETDPGLLEKAAKWGLVATVGTIAGNLAGGGGHCICSLG